MKNHSFAILFDIGNTLTIDEPFLFAQYELIHKQVIQKNPSFTFDKLMTMREKLVLEDDDPNPTKTLGYKFFGEEWKEISKPIRDEFSSNWLKYNIQIKEVSIILEQLSKNYDLGICANQPSSAKKHLELLGLDKFFNVIGISEDSGLKKPDPEFFKKILADMEHNPGDTIMIGDRIDNDIAPAQKLGLKTILVSLPFSKYIPNNSSVFLKYYLGSLEKAPSRGKSKESSNIFPDATIYSFDELPSILSKIIL